MSDPKRPNAASIFEAALDLPPDEREDFVTRAAAGDAALVVEVLGLLAADEAADDFLDRPPRFDDTIDGTGEFEADHHPDLGRVVGPYRIDRLIGRGGMGSVFLAARTTGDFDQLVAVKILRRGMDTDDLLARFRRERRLLARLEHAHIARVIDGGSTDDGRPWLAMEYVEGHAIDVHCNEKQLDARARIRLFLNVCKAVQHAHRNLVVHRDLKPSNVQVTDDGTVKLLDFGIAKVIDPDDRDTEVTATHVRLLSPRYGSPEQMRGETVGTASDVYSLGVVLYELLAGRSPYADDTGALKDIERRVLRDEPLPPSTAVTPTDGSTTAAPGVDTEQLRRTLRGDLDTIVLKALRKEPERRYTSVDELAEDLRRYLDGRPVLARPDSFGYRTRKFLRRNAAAVTATAVVAVALVAATLVSSTLYVRAQRAQQLAEAERETASAVAGFLQEMMGSIGPTVAQGDDTTLLRRLLTDAGARIDDELAERPDVAASLHHTLGGAYLDLVELEAAEHHLRRATELDPDGDLDRWAGLGGALVESGKYDEAYPLLRETMERADLRGDVRAGARARRFLSTIHEVRREREAAEALLRDADRMLADAGEDQMRVSMLGSLGIFLTYNLQRYAEADSILVVASALARESSPGVLLEAGTWQMHGTVKRRLRQFAAADSLYAMAHAVYDSVLDPDHAQVASLKDVWAGSLEEQGRFDEAEVLYREALATGRTIYGDQHRQTGTLANNLANCLRKAGRHDEAVPYFELAESAYTAALGADHVWMAIILGNVADNHLARSEVERALQTAERCHELRARYWEADHWRVAMAAAIRGSARSRLGDVEAGEADMIAALALVDAGQGADSVRSQQIVDYLREHFARTGRTAPAAVVTRF